MAFWGQVGVPHLATLTVQTRFFSARGAKAAGNEGADGGRGRNKDCDVTQNHFPIELGQQLIQNSAAPRGSTLGQVRAKRAECKAELKENGKNVSA